jgi:hypothetical protein
MVANESITPLIPKKRNRKESRIIHYQTVNHQTTNTAERGIKDHSKKLQENQQNHRHKPITFNNNLEYKWTKFSNEKVQTGFKKAQ